MIAVAFHTAGALGKLFSEVNENIEVDDDYDYSSIQPSQQRYWDTGFSANISEDGAGSWDAFPEKTQSRFQSQTDATYKAFESNLANPTTLADIEKLNLPVTVICGEQTTAPDRRVTELLRDTLPNGRYRTIPGAEHMSPLTHPATVANLIQDHLSTDAAGETP